MKDIVDALNIKDRQIKLERIEHKGNTLFIKIVDATYLSQQIGNAGPRSYFAEATFSLTEIDGVNGVNFNFKESDHASPKMSIRDSFDDLNSEKFKLIIYSGDHQPLSTQHPTFFQRESTALGSKIEVSFIIAALLFPSSF